MPKTASIWSWCATRRRLIFILPRPHERLGIPVLFYVAPQLWAWAPWRIYKLRRCCTKLACILPFEQEWFSSRGVDATYVCNPLFDTLDEPVQHNTKAYTAYRTETPPHRPAARLARRGDCDPVAGDAQDRVAAEGRPSAGDFVACAADTEKLAAMKTDGARRAGGAD